MPYTLFLVEDEVVTRDGIRNSVDWNSAGFRWGGEAPDGELALSLIEDAPPDILITDIRMPFMDGLELSRIVRERFPETRIIILSGHDEFRYAQEAMQLGATEYLLKPVGAQELLATLARVSAQIDQKREEQEELSLLRSRLDKNLNVMRQRLLIDLVTGRLSTSAAVDEAQKVGADLMARCYQALIVRCRVTDEMGHLARLEAYHSVRQRVADFLGGRGDVLFFVKDVEECGLIVKGESADALQAAAARLAQQLTTRLQGSEGLVIGVGMGRMAQRLSELPQSFLDAVDAAKTQTGRQADEWPRISLSPHRLPTLDPTAVIDFLRRGEPAGLDRFLDAYLGPVSPEDEDAAAMLEYLVTDLLVAVARFARELGGTLEDILPERAELQALVRTGNASPQLREVMRRLLTQALAYRDLRTDRTRQIIDRAKSYIDHHLTDEEISLHTVAAEVGWSPSHLSAVFSNATDETFIEYLTRQRIQRAGELLRMTALPTAEVGRRVGYANPRYFYAVFRKATGQTPTEFRRNGSTVVGTAEIDR
ncbi:MAG: response regulator [Caldilineaceae bacterium]|nr:response regulator [Caldilineaceae bacterium]